MPSAPTPSSLVTNTVGRSASVVATAVEVVSSAPPPASPASSSELHAGEPAKANVTTIDSRADTVFRRMPERYRVSSASGC
ncbi:MAG: hypothetical protein M5U19_22075 [Microthrixaceae bacterium]|nr:hypothetical protein [Microthrixaceae bacterium]